MQSQKRQNDLCSFSRQTIQYHGNPSLCPDQECWRSWSWMVLWRSTRPSRTNSQNRCPLGDWNAKVGSQETPGITGKFGLGVQNEAGQIEWSRANRVLPRDCTGHSKHPFPTTQEKTLHMDITRWPTPKSDWLCPFQPKMEKLSTVSKNKTGSWVWLRSWTPYCQIQA